ncbi:MAG: NADH-quinone oxidoreductase subunit NuoE [Casimicrobiaceae bacterium]|nr:NADH-quinone oxidoreductase subunit NuoE [Casimicrobiaceae bacterium]MDW8311318.1 NADH-quinone oxidoreductase subunit NuoE [Burkholderiales bacterium]
MALSEEARRRIDRELSKFPPDQRQSAVMAALAIVQRERGWLSTESMREVAEYLGMPPIAVYEVATFYSMYDLKPVGRFKLTLCTNLPCQLQGAGVCAQHARQRLGIEFGETSADGLFTLKEGECFGACGDAPVVLVNNHEMRVKVTPERFDQLIEELRTKARES